MAAPMFKNLQATTFHRLWKQLWYPPITCGCGTQQVRYKKGKGRFKAPPTEKEKAKWVPKVKSVAPAKSLGINKQWLPASTDDVWIHKDYAKQKYTFEKAISMHLELAHPEMMDNLNAFVFLVAELDMSTKKKTKFLSGVNGTVILPHLFNDGTEKRVLAFCKTQEEKERAEELGATFAGGIDLIKAIQRGDIHSDEYDHVVSTMEMITEVTAIRKLLHLDFPSQSKGSLGVDLCKMIQHFTLGQTYQSEKFQPEIADIKLNLGQLIMGFEALQDNLEAYINDICTHRPASLGQFIKYGEIVWDPPQETLELLPSELLSLEEKQLNAKESSESQEVDDDEHDKQTARSTS